MFLLNVFGFSNAVLTLFDAKFMNDSNECPFEFVPDSGVWS